MPSFKLTKGDERDEIIEEVIEYLRAENFNVSGVIKDALEAHFKLKGWWALILQRRQEQAGNQTKTS